MLRSWRWAAVAAGVAALVSLPTLAGALPTRSSDVTAEELRDLVRASGAVAHEAYGESRVDLPLPDVDALGDVPELLGSTTRTRTAWRTPLDWRVDRLTVAGETDVVRAGALTTTWDSADRSVTRLLGDLPVRLPRPDDLTAPVLARRLVATPGTVLSRLPERRVAGRSAPGLRVAPADPAQTLVESVDVWVEPGSGLPLRVEVRADGQRNPVVTAVVLDLELGDPGARRTAFDPPPGSTETTTQAPDVAAEVDRLVPFLLPDVLAGDGRADPAGLGTGGVAVYDRGFEAYAVVPLDRDLGGDLLDLAPPGGVFATPLVTVLVGRVERTAYVLVGTVPEQVLRDALTALRRDPPPFVGDR